MKDETDPGTRPMMLRGRGRPPAIHFRIGTYQGLTPGIDDVPMVACSVYSPVVIWTRERGSVTCRNCQQQLRLLRYLASDEPKAIDVQFVKRDPKRKGACAYSDPLILDLGRN